MTIDGSRLFEEAPAAYVVLDRDQGRIIEANHAFLTLVGRTRDEVLADTLADVLSVGGRIYVETHLMPMLDLHGRVDEVALDVVTSAGLRVPVLLNANLDRTGSRTIVRAVLFAAEARRRYETRLLESTREAEDARQHAVDLAKTLQEALIPPVPPVIPNLEIAAVYRPAGAGDEVGGDFYDVFNVAPSEWTVVLGDVAGKGIPAATVTSFIRHTVRDLAMQEADPARLLHALDQALRDHPTDKFCTVVVLRLRERTTGWTLTGAAGGHPLPLLGHRDGTVVELGSPGSLVGVLHQPTFTTFRHELGADEFVTLYTDGVSEARHGRALLGEEAVRAVVSAAAADPQRVSEAVVEAALEFQEGNARDDIAVLTLHPTAKRGQAAPEPTREEPARA